MSSNVSEPGAAGTPVTNVEQLTPEPFVQEYLRLVDEGWDPDLREFVDRVPESVREEVYQRLDEALEQRTERTWDPDPETPAEPEALDADHVLRQSVVEESPDAILAAAMDETEEPPQKDHIAADDTPAAAVIALAETYDLDEERFAPAELPEPDPVQDPEPELALEPEPQEPEEPEPLPEEEVAHAAPSFAAGLDLVHSMGSGTLGESFFGTDEQGQQKVVTVASAEIPDKVLQRLYSEAAKVKALRVDQLVAIEETRQEPTGPIIIAPFIEGQQFDVALIDLELDDRVRYLQLVIEALASAHAAGLTHLDLKPSNVLVTPDGDVRILDWGVGASVLAVPDRMARLAGPEHYESPEHARRARVSAASDIFAFGSLMYRVLTRKLPFPGGAPDVIRGRIDTCEPLPPRLHDDGIPRDLQDICLACLSRNPGDRPDASTLIANLDRYLVGSPVRLRPSVYRSALRRESRELIAQASAWEDQGFAEPIEADRLTTLGRRILAREEQWSYDRAHAPRKRAVIVAGAWLFALSAGLLASFGYAHVSAFAAFFPIGGVIALWIAGLRSGRGDQPAMADAAWSGALIALAPAVATILQRTGFLAGTAPVAGISWLQMAACAGLVCVGAAGMLYRRREAAYAWIACGAFVATWCAAVGVLGLASFGALSLVPLALLLIVAQQFEAHDRFAWMRPFFWTGLGALTLVPLSVALFGGWTPLPGIEIAMVGLLWAAAVPFLANSSSAALRETAHWLRRVVPGVIVAGVFWHALATGDTVAWIGALALGLVLSAHGAVLRRSTTFGWGLAAVLCTAAVPALRGFATPWTLSIVIGVAGLLAATLVAFASVPRRQSP